MIAHKSITAFVLTRRGKFVLLMTAFVMWLCVLSSLEHVQSKTNQRKNIMAQSEATKRSGERTSDKNAIRPYQVSIPEEKLVDLRRRIAATQWPEKEAVADQSQG